MTGSDQNTARELREALRPLWRQLNADRTLSIGKIGALAHLADNGPATSSTLAAAERISPQAIATAVRELEALGLVEREPDENDRRRVWVTLREAGRERLARERRTGNAWLEQVVADRLDDEERALLDTVIPVLRKLTDGSADD